MQPRSLVLPVVALLVAASTTAPAASIGVSVGTASPPSSLGPYTLTPFPDDTSAENSTLTSLASPLGGNLVFSESMQHKVVPTSWSTWSQSLSGIDVYYRAASAALLDIDLPAGTTAFLLYAQPNLFSSFNITVTASDSTSVTQSVSGSGGASGFGFYILSGTLDSVQISSDDGFAIGQLAIAGGGLSGEVPEPGTFVAGSLVAAGVAGGLYRRRQQGRTATGAAA